MRRRLAFLLSVILSANFLALPAASTAAVILHPPRVPVPPPHGPGVSSLWYSSNWSGYAITGGPYTSVSGQWTVSAVQPSRKGTYSSSWVGVDGFNNSSLIQTGTEADYYSGSAHYAAWWEILPAPETVIPSITVHPGDTMSATIAQISAGQWTITLADATTGKSFNTTVSYSGPLTSAEWIEEAPVVGGRVATLANYGTVPFNYGTVNGGNPGLVAAEGGAMIQRVTQVSTPSVPDGDTDGFTMAYGSTAPSPPSP